MRQPWTIIRICEFFCPLSIASVDDKQHLSEVDFFGDILWYQECKKPGKPKESGFSPKKSESSALLQSFRHFHYNENPTRALNTTSLNCRLPSTDDTNRREKFTYPYEGSRSPHASALHWDPSGFRKKIMSDFSNRLVFQKIGCLPVTILKPFLSSISSTRSKVELKSRKCKSLHLNTPNYNARFLLSFDIE